MTGQQFAGERLDSIPKALCEAANLAHKVVDGALAAVDLVLTCVPLVQGLAAGVARMGVAAMARPAWAYTPGGFVNWCKNISGSGKTLTAAQADAIIAEAQRLGVYVRLDPGHIKTKWPMPHLNLGNANVHLPVPPGYTNPNVPIGHP